MLGRKVFTSTCQGTVKSLEDLLCFLKHVILATYPFCVLWKMSNPRTKRVIDAIYISDDDDDATKKPEKKRKAMAIAKPPEVKEAKEVKEVKLTAKERKREADVKARSMNISLLTTP
jgi:hypothetical protein